MKGDGKGRAPNDQQKQGGRETRLDGCIVRTECSRELLKSMLMKQRTLPRFNEPEVTLTLNSSPEEPVSLLPPPSSGPALKMPQVDSITGEVKPTFPPPLSSAPRMVSYGFEAPTLPLETDAPTMPDVSYPPTFIYVPSSSTRTATASSASYTTNEDSTTANYLLVPQTLQKPCPPTLVHRACVKFSQSESVIARAVLQDPEGVSRRLPRTRSDFLSRRMLHEYDYPINIALEHKASLPVLKMLAKSAPEILTNGDGHEWGSSLSCALYMKQGIDVLSMLLKANRAQVRVRDHHMNYPLHVACLVGSPLPIIKLLASRYRCALRKKNFHGLTPLDIAQQNPCCNDEVVDYLYLRLISFAPLEESAIHFMEAASLYATHMKDIGNDHHEDEEYCESKGKGATGNK